MDTDLPVFRQDPELSRLDREIIRQVEFYFGNYNLPKDRFMLEKMDEDDGEKREKEIRGGEESIDVQQLGLRKGLKGGGSPCVRNVGDCIKL